MHCILEPRGRLSHSIWQAKSAFQPERLERLKDQCETMLINPQIFSERRRRRRATAVGAGRMATKSGLSREIGSSFRVARLNNKVRPEREAASWPRLPV